jgi:hypothetical protein
LLQANAPPGARDDGFAALLQPGRDHAARSAIVLGSNDVATERRTISRYRVVTGFVDLPDNA